MRQERIERAILMALSILSVRYIYNDLNNFKLMNLAFEPFAQSINLNSIHPSILFFFFFYCKLF